MYIAYACNVLRQCTHTHTPFTSYSHTRTPNTFICMNRIYAILHAYVTARLICTFAQWAEGIRQRHNIYNTINPPTHQPTGYENFGTELLLLLSLHLVLATTANQLSTLRLHAFNADKQETVKRVCATLMFVLCRTLCLYAKRTYLRNTGHLAASYPLRSRFVKMANLTRAVGAVDYTHHEMRCEFSISHSIRSAYRRAHRSAVFCVDALTLAAFERVYSIEARAGATSA